MIRLIKFCFSVFLLLVLLVVADRLSARVAGQVVADRIKASQHLTTTPTVSVDGFPFLTQLVAGTYHEVDVTAHDVHDTQHGDVRATSLDLHLYGVHVAVGDVVSQAVKGIRVDHGSGTVDLSYADINALVKPEGIKVTGSDVAGAFTVSGSVKVAGQSVKGSGQGSVAAVPAGIQVTVSDIRSAGLTTVLTTLLRTKLSFLIPTSSLPFGVSVKSAAVTSAGLQVSATIGAFTIPVG